MLEYSFFSEITEFYTSVNIILHFNNLYVLKKICVAFRFFFKHVTKLSVD